MLPDRLFLCALYGEAISLLDILVFLTSRVYTLNVFTVIAPLIGKSQIAQADSDVLSLL